MQILPFGRLGLHISDLRSPFLRPSRTARVGRGVLLLLVMIRPGYVAADAFTFPSPPARLQSVVKESPAAPVVNEPGESRSEKNGGDTSEDVRLRQKIDLSLKGGDIGELSRLLTEKTGIPFTANKEISDWKLSVLARQQPLGQIMQQVAWLYDLRWRKMGEEPNFRYTVYQSVKDRLEEEEQEKKKRDELLNRLIEDLEQYRDYAQLQPDQLQEMSKDFFERSEAAGSIGEKLGLRKQGVMLQNLADTGFRAAYQLYLQLSVDQIVQLQNGQPLEIDGDRMSGLWSEAEKWLRQTLSAGRPPESVSQEDLEPSIQFQLSFDDYQGVSLGVQWGVHHNNYPVSQTIMGLNADELALRDRAADSQPGQSSLLDRPVDIDPPSALKLTVQNEDPTVKAEQVEFIDSADFFEELQKKSGINIVSDYYLSLYPKRSFAAKSTKLSQLLPTVGNLLKSDWQINGEFLRFRAHDFTVKRGREVPNRILQRWKVARQQRGYLTLDDATALLPAKDDLTAFNGTQGIVIKWGLKEFGLFNAVFPLVRFYDSLNLIQRNSVQSIKGLAIGRLSPRQFELLKHWGLYPEVEWDKVSPDTTLSLLQRKPGSYWWYSKPLGKGYVPGMEEVRTVTKDQAEAKVETLLKARGGSDRSIQLAKLQVRGPDTEFWIRLGDNTWGLDINGGTLFPR